jgi:signal transduction histidine kinase
MIMKTLPRLFLRYILGILAILAFSLVFFVWLMHPPLGDLALTAQFLSITAVISVLVGYITYRLGWMERSPSLHLTLMGVYALASILAFINVWVTARLMFINQHDLRLATVLLVFAGGIAMGLGFFLSSAITDRLQAIQQVAEEVQRGNLEARINVHGNDELAALGTTINQTTTRLQEAAQKQHELENLRRDLIAWAGHDLQTPLASVRAIVEALADGVVEDVETTQRYLRTAQRDVQSLSLLIDDLFQMAQLDAGGMTLNREKASLSDLISDTLESFSELASRQQVTLSGEVKGDVDPVFMDVPHVGRVLNNLIGNALRHTLAGGRITVQATRDPQGVRVEVRDTGEGIPDSDLPHVFERFYRGEKSRSRSTGGAGLGLAISRGIVEAHGGQIGAESAPGQGACFHFTLPDLIPFQVNATATDKQEYREQKQPRK